MRITIILGMFLLNVFSSALHSQTIQYPTNDKASGDIENLPRPRLAFYGFTTPTNGQQYYHTLSGKSYSLKDFFQEHLLLSNGTTQIKRRLDSVVAKSGRVVLNPNGDNEERKKNVRRLEAQAFLSLITLITQKNDIIINTHYTGVRAYLTTLGIDANGNGTADDHHKVRTELIKSFRSAFRNVPTPDGQNLIFDYSFFVAQHEADEIFKEGATLQILARAWDFYLALEVAYSQTGYVSSMGYNSGMLLSNTEKQLVNDGLQRAISRIWRGIHTDDENLIQDILNANYNVAQAGNWPHIGRVAVGYALLAHNGNFASIGDDYHNSIFNRTLSKHEIRDKIKEYAGYNSTINRQNNWAYQTDGGKRFWAEGPYYLGVAAKQTLSYWHAMRNCGMTNGDDPFTNSKLLNPFHWVADIVAPDGQIPPIDDGNKEPINYAAMLSWNSSYGESSISQKFASIGQMQSNNTNFLSGHPDFLTQELSIPRTTTSTYILPKITNTGNQLVSRLTAPDGSKHYIFLNTETQNSIAPAEEHEQPDQLNLLYYVGLHPTTKDTTLPTAWFDDRTRILRVQVKDSSSPQLHMELDGLAKRSPMLVPIGNGWQETALQVPETVAEIKLMNPTTQAFLTPDVPLQGAVVVME